MKRTAVQPFLWLTVLVGCSGLLSAIPQPVRGQTNSPVLLAQRSDELEEAKRLNQQAYQLYQQGKYNEAIPIVERVLEMRQKLWRPDHPDTQTFSRNLQRCLQRQGSQSE